MATGLNPVIQAFLAAQVGQTQQLQAGQEIIDRQKLAKERQKQLDETIREHDIQNKQVGLEYALRQKAQESAFKQQLFANTRSIQAGMRSGEIPLEMAKTGFNIPGLSAPEQMAESGSPFGDTPEIPLSESQVIPREVPAEFQDIQFPGMETAMRVRQPQLTEQQESYNTSLQKGIDLYNATTAKEGILNRTGRVAAAENSAILSRERMIQSDRQHEESNRLRTYAANAAISAAETKASLAAATTAFNLGIPGGLENIRTFAAKAADEIGSGHASISDFNPIVKEYIKVDATSRGINVNLSDAQRKSLTTFYDTPRNLTELNSLGDQLNNSIKVPSNKAGQIANWIGMKFGSDGLNADKSLFQAYSVPLATKYDLALGIPIGSMSRNQQLLAMVKATSRLPGDSAETIQEKTGIRNDISLGAMSRAAVDVAKSPDHRKLLYRNLVQSNPGFIADLDPDTKSRFLEATRTGNFRFGKATERLKGTLDAK